jgi:hypothetical protein
MFWLSYERWDFAGFGGFWYKSGGRTTGVGVQAGNRLSRMLTTLLSSHRQLSSAYVLHFHILWWGKVVRTCKIT